MTPEQRIRKAAEQQRQAREKIRREAEQLKQEGNDEPTGSRIRS